MRADGDRDILFGIFALVICNIVTTCAVLQLGVLPQEESALINNFMVITHAKTRVMRDTSCVFMVLDNH